MFDFFILIGLISIFILIIATPFWVVSYIFKSSLKTKKLEKDLKNSEMSQELVKKLKDRLDEINSQAIKDLTDDEIKKLLSKVNRT